MANADRPRGFWPVGKLLRTGLYEAGSTVYPGDVVTLATDGQVDAVTAGVICLGVAISYATVGQELMVADAPQQLFGCQADETEVDAQTDIGSMFDITATAGDSTYKISRHELDSSTVGSGSAQVQLLRIERRPDNALGTNVDCIVRINEHQLGDAIAGLA